MQVRIIKSLRLNRSTGLADLINIEVKYTSDEGGDAMTISFGDTVLSFRYEDIQRMIRQETVRHG